MPTSGTVTALVDKATAAQYNNLRTDVLVTHDHDGTEGNAEIKATTFSGIATVSAAWIHSATVTWNDTVNVIFGTGGDAAMRWSTGDASNHTLTIGLGNSNQSLHITDLAAIGTDWNVGAESHPTIYIHSNTTPATDYMRMGGHDGTTAFIDVVGGTTFSWQIGG